MQSRDQPGKDGRRTTGVVVDVQPAFDEAMAYSGFDAAAMVADLNAQEGRLVIIYTDPLEGPFHKGDDLATVRAYYQELGLQREAEFWPKSYGYITPWLRHMELDEVACFIQTEMVPQGIADASQLDRSTIECFLDDEGIEVEDQRHFWANLPLLPTSLIEKLKTLDGPVETSGGSTHRCLMEVEFLIRQFTQARPVQSPHLWNDSDHGLRQGIDADLQRLKSTLPRYSHFDWWQEDEVLHIDLLMVPGMRKGVGTEFVARVLALADRHGMTTTLHADATDVPGEPSTYDLVRWYSRFGFDWTGLNDDGWCAMRREPQPPAGGHPAVLARYGAAKSQGDMSHDQFADRMHSYLDASCQSAYNASGP